MTARHNAHLLSALWNSLLAQVPQYTLWPHGTTTWVTASVKHMLHLSAEKNQSVSAHVIKRRGNDSEPSTRRINEK